MWQDIVFMVGGFCFSIALLPSIRSKDKPAWTTSLTTGGILACFCVCYATLGLWLAFMGTLLTCGCWFTLFVQKLANK